MYSLQSHVARRGPNDEVVIRIQTTDWPERSSCCAPIVPANNFPNRWPRHRREIGADLVLSKRRIITQQEPRSGNTTIQVPKRMPNGNDCAKETDCLPSDPAIKLRARPCYVIERTFGRGGANWIGGEERGGIRPSVHRTDG